MRLTEWLREKQIGEKYSGVLTILFFVTWLFIVAAIVEVESPDNPSLEAGVPVDTK